MADQTYPTQQPQQQAGGYDSYYAQRQYQYGYQQPPPQEEGQNLQPVYIGLGLIAVVAIISIALLVFGGGGEERFDPALAEVGPSEEARVLVYCDRTCDEDRIEGLGGTILARFENEDAVLIVIEGAQIEELLDENWVKRLAKPL